MYHSSISFQYLGGAPVNCAFTVGTNYYCMGSYKSNKHFYLDDNLNVRIVEDDCFLPVEKSIRVVIDLPKQISSMDRAERLKLCQRWEISEPTLKDWIENRPLLISDALKGMNKQPVELVNLPELAQSTGNYWSELACRWGYFNPQSVNRMIVDGRRLKLFSDAFRGLM